MGVIMGERAHIKYTEKTVIRKKKFSKVAIMYIRP